jgi:hypothetical protein
MKTAMQELIDDIQQAFQGQWGVYLNSEKFAPYLEKEKEQIIEAGNACSIKTIVHKEKLDKMSEDELRDSLVEDTISYGEDYYNQTYNQQ